MSSTNISFRATFRIGDDIVPLLSEIAFGDSQSQDGVQNGFLFRLDLQPNDPPVQINLGALIGFVEQQLGVGSGNLQSSDGISTLQQIFPGTVTGSNFNSNNTTVIEVRQFEINSTSQQFLFKISVDVESSDPTQGIIPLPPTLASWLNIQSLAISFAATTKSA
jgi:hypothetical protein